MIRDERELCLWAEDEYQGDMWSTGCGATWTFIDDGPAENGVKFCMKCGKPIVAVPFVEPEEEPL